MGYPNGLLATRAIVRPGLYAVIPASGLVNNVIPNIKDCRVSILTSPKIGASFVEYLVTAEPCGGTTSPFASEEGIEGFLYCLEGNIEVTAGEKNLSLKDGGYLYTPSGMGFEFINRGNTPARLLLYKQRFIPVSAEYGQTYLYTGNVNEMAYRIYDNMENVFIKDLLPTDLAFDMNMHILSFAPGGCHPFVETHVQEHGAYVLSGEGMYLLDEEWRGVQKNDFLWFGPYVAQASYGVGREPFTYIYSKDCNRDVAL